MDGRETRGCTKKEKLLYNCIDIFMGKIGFRLRHRKRKRENNEKAKRMRERVINKDKKLEGIERRIKGIGCKSVCVSACKCVCECV